MTRKESLFMLQEYVSMKAEELRYGNKVTLGDGIVVRTVIETREKSVYLQGLYSVSVDNVKPIELNDEILDKNFEIDKWSKKHWVLANCWQMWRNPNYGYILGTLDVDEFGGGHYIPCIPCTYFHELQNLLVDLRIDKKIEI